MRGRVLVGPLSLPLSCPSIFFPISRGLVLTGELETGMTTWYGEEQPNIHSYGAEVSLEDAVVRRLAG